MKIRLLVIVLTVWTACGHLPIAAAQTSRPRDWAAVMALPLETKVNVKLKTGKTVEGKVTDVSDTRLQLMKGNSKIDLDRDEIKKIFRVGGRQPGKSTLLGLGIGAGAGVVLGGVVAATDGPTESGEGHLPIAIIGAAGAMIGTGTGLIMGLLGRKKILIYEAN